MDKNKIKHPETKTVTATEKAEMTAIVNRVIELIKVKHT